MLSELLSMRDTTANQYFGEIVFLLFVACSANPTCDGYESWLGTMVELINQSKPHELLDLNNVLDMCCLDTRKVILRTSNHKVFVRFTDNLFLKITNGKRNPLFLSPNDRGALEKCLSATSLQEYRPLIQSLLDNQIGLVNENTLMELVVNEDFQRICNISNGEISGAVFTIAGVEPTFVGDVADRFNQGATILVSMLPNDSLPLNAAAIESKFNQVREKSGYYCGTAISPETSPLHLFGEAYFVNPDVNNINIGLIYLDDVINERDETQQAILNKSGVVGDAYSNGRTLPVTQFRSGDTGFYRGGYGGYGTTARDKSYKNGVPRPSDKIPMAINDHMIKHFLYPRSDLPYQINQASSEINFIPKTESYLKAVFGIIVDARNKVSLDVEMLVDVTKFDNWENIIRTSKRLDKQIYILYTMPSGKLGLINSKDVSIIPKHIYTQLKYLYNLSSYTSEFLTIEGHTESVMWNFRNYYRDNCEATTGLSEELWYILLALHDIGKGLNSNTRAQHVNTKVVIKDNRDAIGLSHRDSNIISIIVAQDPIGEFFKGDINEEEAAIILRKSYLQLLKYIPDLTKYQYIKLMKYYYSCDAASYEGLRDMIFDADMNFLLKYQKEFDILFDLFSNGDHVQISSQQIRHYTDHRLLVRDFSRWLNKYSPSFPEHSVAVFNIDDNIDSSILDLINQLHKSNIRIVLFIDDDDSDDSIIQQLAKRDIKVWQCYYNANKKEVFAQYDEQNIHVACSFGSELDGLYNYHKPIVQPNSDKSELKKSRSYWIR